MPLNYEPFPDVLYVHRSHGSSLEAPFDGYTDYKNAEEDDTVAVYSLEYLAKVRVKKETYLEEISDKEDKKDADDSM